MKRGRIPQTRLAQHYWNQLLEHKAGGQSVFALDATAGNGHDTLKLAEKVGPKGRVWAFDVQADAIAASAERLLSAGFEDRVELICADHAEWPLRLPEDVKGRLDLAVFNLGFLPGSASGRTTLSDSTLKALAPLADWLRPGGLLTVLCYPGHAEGAEETVAVKGWIGKHRSDFSCWVQHVPQGCKAAPPELHVLMKGEA